MLTPARLERRPQARSLFDAEIVGGATRDSFLKLDPRWQIRNPVMFTVEVGAVVTTILFFRDLATHVSSPTSGAGFDFAISAWLWFTVLFANFAEAMAEGRGKAQAEFLRRTRSETSARKIVDAKET